MVDFEARSSAVPLFCAVAFSSRAASPPVSATFLRNVRRPTPFPCFMGISILSVRRPTSFDLCSRDQGRHTVRRDRRHRPDLHRSELSFTSPREQPDAQALLAGGISPLGQTPRSERRPPHPPGLRQIPAPSSSWRLRPW